MKKIRVAAAIICKDGKVFAARRKGGTYDGFWEFPGGKIESGETAEQALIREVREELNAEISIQSFFKRVRWEYPEFILSMDCFLCSLKTPAYELCVHQDARWLDTTEINSVQWLPADISIIEKLKTVL
ncbi:(deoxy)nucleoside triphosphate pyrophosphohydrolase [Treponema phagedenis]|uniref:(deoxy)nucleoside triphosphate pyrophosphohydrolase n=1 Tax=Treponema phagedenis TaxID=162 RepID=UPI001583E228|nr:(deoxy)nucleoside triphosphate pyrophosphohydrolase [Treponema phagedenis]NVP24583.1 (deoxy)nucleoside triphosphate pyrophosphohydrolase [Treponema phagedenis]QKS92017.1 (deoxy)nucleoside triphosphate pyrophosphohydrolase [Treponema phagedenis]QLC58785.1 (deoxy)nucleoside triphosphate pyrophosphohydrolase [Treponema phagedenis]